MNTKEVVVVAGVRTPIGNFGGSLKDVPLVQLGGKVIGDVLRSKGLRPLPPSGNVEYRPALLEKGIIELEKKYYNWDDSAKGVQVDEVIMGNVLQAGQGQNPARQATIVGGLPKEVNAYAVNKLCASGLKAIALGVQTIATGAADVIVSGGMESMSNVPYALPKARWGYRMDTNGRGEVYDLMVFDGLLESLYGYHMGMTAENVAEKYGITRKECDELALLSHTRAVHATDEGRFRREIVPVEIKTKKETKIFDTDEHPIRNASMETMGQLPTVFKKGGVVTAANASGINDGASAAVVMSKDKAGELGLKPLLKLINICGEGVDPVFMGLGPAVAVPKCLKQAGMKFKDVEYWEFHEAFAAQWLGAGRKL